MKEIIQNVEGILSSYDISFSKLNEYNTRMLLLEAANASRLQKYVKERFKKELDPSEAQELEILFLTYQYVAQN